MPIENDLKIKTLKELKEERESQSEINKKEK